ncbi:uncharacterized protein LOC126965523 [Leptidea sinapis]|uniref:Uncharacterized protein n=1 Tax=Leptidea sinapis TaxID=189913 RepID=A0A5E4QXC5_9NEOP|nr:uncharacterized protein LOC126965523 [Leptidea sinapis]VVD02650.1 unnamed protein product [Leptidea sinapis]
MGTPPTQVGIRPKKQNHANIPCPIEDCARFTYGKLPDHLTKIHGLIGAERDALNEQQRKRFFNGELCQVRYLKESAIRDLWGIDYDDPRIRAKIHQSYALVKIRIIPLAATQRCRPLTEQDANVLTAYNARTAPRPARVQRNRTRARPYPIPETSPAERVSSESSEGEEITRNSLPLSPPPSSPSLPPSPAPYELQPVETRLRDIFDSKVDAGYKAIIDDMKKSMTMGRTLGTRKRKAYRMYRRYAKRLIAFLHRQHSPLAYDVDVLLCGERQVCAFLDRISNEHKTKTLRNYIVAAIKLLDSRLMAIERDNSCKEKVVSMTRVYEVLLGRLHNCDGLLTQKDVLSEKDITFDSDAMEQEFNESFHDDLE